MGEPRGNVGDVQFADVLSGRSFGEFWLSLCGVLVPDVSNRSHDMNCLSTEFSRRINSVQKNVANSANFRDCDF